MSDKSHFSLSAKEYEDVRGGHLEERRISLVEEAIDKYSSQIRYVLEIGFGTGKIMAHLATKYPSITFVGTEVEPKMVIHAQKQYPRNNATYLLVSDSGLSHVQRYDFVYSIDVLHHIHDSDLFLSTIRSYMNEDARWLMIEPNIWHPYIYYQQNRMRRNGLDEDQFRPWVFMPIFRRNSLTIYARRYAFLFPGIFKRIPGTLQSVEQRLERFRLLGGSVVYIARAEKS